MFNIRVIFRHRRIVIAASFAAYFAIYMMLRQSVGSESSGLISLPIALIAWWYGRRIGLISMVCALLGNMIFVIAVGDRTLDEGILWTANLFGALALLVFTLALGSVHDLSEQLKRELNMRVASEKAERQRSAELEALHNASLLLTSSLELKPVLSTIMQQVTALLGAPEVHIFLYDGENLSFGAAFWDGKEQAAPLRVPRPGGLTATVAQTRQRRAVTDMSTDPMMRDREWTGASISLPLQIGDMVYGVMNVSFDQPREFPDSEVRVIQLFADQATLALRNARAYENTKQYAEVLEQRVAERTAELLRAKEGAEALLNNSFDVILRLDVDGTIQQTNPAFVRVFGISEGQGRAFASLFQDADVIEDALQAVVAERRVYQCEATARRDDGGEFTTDLAFVPLDGAGESLEIICNLRDVTERKRAEMRQQALVTGQRKVLALTYDLISSPDTDSLWKRAVEDAREQLGLERCAIFVEQDGFMRGTYGTDSQGQTSDESGQRWFVKTTPWAERSHLFKPDAPRWEKVMEARREWRDGSSVPVGQGWVVYTPIHSAYRFIGILVNDALLSGAPVDDIQQEIVALFCSFLGGLYEHKRVEDEMRRALEREKELSELKSRFTSMISHELRTPLSTIQLSSDLLKRYADRLSQDATVKHIDKIQAQVKHLTNLLEDVLTFTRAEGVGLQTQLRSVDLKAFCAELTAEVRATHPTHQVVFKDCAGTWMGTVDSKLLRQALLNLLLNAIKYSPHNTLVTLSLEREANDAVIKVADQGIGIPESDLGQIFDVFYRAKNVGAVSGTGLGLALVHQIAEAHHGFVFCQSQVGIGTTFTFRFPAFG